MLRGGGFLIVDTVPARAEPGDFPRRIRSPWPILSFVPCIAPTWATPDSVYTGYAPESSQQRQEGQSQGAARTRARRARPGRRRAPM